VSCEKSSNADLPRTDGKSLVGVVLNAFDSPCERFIAPIAVNVIPVAFAFGRECLAYGLRHFLRSPRQQQAPNWMTGQEPRGTTRIAIVAP
jgi:hypothetical protein